MFIDCLLVAYILSLAFPPLMTYFGGKHHEVHSDPKGISGPVPQSITQGGLVEWAVSTEAIPVLKHPVKTYTEQSSNK